MIRILFIGDIVGRPGRYILSNCLKDIKEEKNVDFCIANAENLANGSGITPNTLNKLFSYGVDVATSGDHVYKNKEVINIIDKEPRLLRPANYPERALGKGYGIYTIKDKVKIGVINLIGRIFMDPANCPFLTADRLIETALSTVKIIVVDIHAEATSEKVALGRYLDGRVSAIIGTHTHIQTADDTILPGGSAYITDVGMTGPYNSVIGREISPVLKRLITGMPARFDVAKNDLRIGGVIIDINEDTGKAQHIERIMIKLEE